jgi:hypothetical protein
MEVFHVGDKVFLDNMKYERCKKIDIDTEGNQKVSVERIDFKYGKIIAIDTKDNLMRISPINDKIGVIISVHIDSPHIHKIDFLPKEKVVIHDLLKDHYNKKGIVDVYSWQIDRYRVIVDNDPNPHWFAPFELTLKDNDGWSVFSSFNPIKVRLSDEGKKAYEYHFGIKPLVDTNGRTEFTNLAQLMEVYDPTFIYGDKYMLEDDDIFVKVMN